MYHHRQFSWVINLSIGIPLIALTLSIFLFNEKNAKLVLFVVEGILILALLIFFSLNVSVNSNQIIVAFGIGIIKKRIPIQDIEEYDIVRNKWYYGFGIRYVPKSGWMYNVSGLDAIELTYKDGHKFRIGTDQPKKLYQGISQYIS